MKKIIRKSFFMLLIASMICFMCIADAQESTQISQNITDSTIEIKDAVASVNNKSIDLDMTVLNKKDISRLLYIDIKVTDNQKVVTTSGVTRFFDKNSQNTVNITMTSNTVLENPVISVTVDSKEFNPGLCLYVSNDGNDSNSGTLSSPLASINGARDYIRNYKLQNGRLPLGGICVYITDDIYRITDTIEFTSKDSGTKTSPIYFRSYEGTSKITGGVVLEPSDFVTVTDIPTLNKLNSSARGKVVSINLNGYGVKPEKLQGDILNSVESYSMSILSVDGAAQKISRYPNSGFLTTSGCADNGMSLDVPDNKASVWANAPDMMLTGYFSHDWNSEKIIVNSISDSKFNLIKSPRYGLNEGQRFYVNNVIQELDEPGEWYYDRVNNVIYLYPTVDLSNKNIVLSDMKKTMLKFNGTRYIDFSGFEVSDTNNRAVEIYNAENMVINNCKFHSIGNRAIYAKNTSDLSIINCDVYDCAKTALTVSGGYKKSLMASNNIIENCDINNYAMYMDTHAGGINILGVGNVVKNNDIYNSKCVAIQLAGNDNKIINNIFHDVCKDNGDGGAVYGGQSWTQRGNVISGNEFYNIRGFNNGLRAVYMDDLFSGTTVENNIFYNVDTAAHIHGGRDNTIRNNIIVNAQRFSLRIHNIVNQDYPKPGSSVWSDFENSYANTPLWQNKYPHIANVLTDEPERPKYNVVTDNVIYNDVISDEEMVEMHFCTDALECGTINNNLEYNLTKLPGFVNTGAHNYNLRDDSRVYTDLPNFKKIENNFGKHRN